MISRTSTLQRCGVASPDTASRLGIPSFVRRSVCASAGPNKSWGEILSTAGNLAKDVVNKVKDSVGQVLAPPVPADRPAEDRKPVRQPRQPGGPLMQPESPGLLGNLLGRAVGSLVASAVNQIGQQLEKAAEESRGVYDEAAARVVASQKLRSMMGQVRVGPIMSQGISSSSINGVSSKTVNLVFPVYGANGQTAQAQVVSQETPRSRQMDVSVWLPNNTVIKIEERERGGPAGAAGETIDAEFIDIK